MPEPIKTAEQAIARANVLTRLSVISDPPIAVLLAVPEDVTPYLGEPHKGKSAWRVEYPKASLKFDSAVPGFADPYKRTFAVWLEPATGHLFFVASTYEGARDPDMRPMPLCGVATEQLSNEGEVYTGYPAEAPFLDFLAALDCILQKGVGSPFKAKEIHGAYVMHSRMRSTPKPVWAVTLRGIPPIQARGAAADSVPVWQRNHIRNVVDAVSGQVLFANNSPQPI